jgi:RNA polymerase sigma factor (sigma-70 family)
MEVQKDNIVERNLLRIFQKEISAFHLLTKEEEIIIANQARQRDERSINRLIEANLRFVIKLAFQYWRPGLPLIDMVSEGCLGLMAAIETFNPALGYRLITYATLPIKWHIIRAIIDHKKHEHDSLDMPIYDDEGETETPKDLLVSEDPGADEKYFHSQIEHMIGNTFACLNGRERKVIKLRFWHDLTLEEVGLRIGLKKERTRQIEAKALRRLRRALHEKNLEASVFLK